MSLWTGAINRSKLLLFFVVGLTSTRLVMSAAALWAQQITGSITGAITDGSGSFVSNASVKATNTATGYTRSATSNAVGYYNLMNLPVARYAVEVRVPNFRKFVQENLTIIVDQI